MTNIRPEDNELMDLIKSQEYRSTLNRISESYTTMDRFINNLNSDITDIGTLIDKLNRDRKRGYDIGTSLDTLNFQKDTLTLDRDFFENQKKTYLRKIYQDLYKYTNGIIDKAIEIEDNPTDTSDEDLKRIKFSGAREFKEEDLDTIFDMADVFSLISVTERNLTELAGDIASFATLIVDAESKSARGFAVGNMILNLKEQQSTLKFSFQSYCQRLEQFLEENRKFSLNCVKRIEMISGEIVTEEELDAADAAAAAADDAADDAAADNTATDNDTTV